jgi:IS4 transposase
MHACFRVHQLQIVNFRVHRRHAQSLKSAKGLPRSRWLRRLGFHDQVVEWVKPDSRPCWLHEEEFAALPDGITLRELRYRVARRGHRTREVTLVTTLLDPQVYPAAQLAELYQRRWQVETHIRHLKTTMKMDVLHCQTVDGVLKEMWMFVLVYNLVRIVMLEAARRQEVELERISFADALHWLMHAAPDQPLPAIVENPHRPNRIEPRAFKRRPKEYDRLNKPRSEMRKALKKQRHAA